MTNQDEPTCPVCGKSDQMEWKLCPECRGMGTIECICEGMGGEDKCGYGCDELKDKPKARVSLLDTMNLRTRHPTDAEIRRNAKTNY